jgi:hypothetical protein
MRSSSIADPESGARTFGWVVRRLLLYIGLALAALVVFALFFVLSIRLGVIDKVNGWFKGGWVGFLGFSALLFWVTVWQSTALAPLEFLVCDRQSADDSLPSVRRHLTGISGLARHLVLAYHRC